MKKQGPKRLRLRYPGTCAICGVELTEGTEAWWDPEARTVTCVGCEPPGELRDRAGTAGASAQREGERRRANDEHRIRERHPKLGDLLVRIRRERQTTRSWHRGAEGERAVGARLDPLWDEGTAVIHDRRIHGTRANVDHIVVAPSGVHVIDAKRYRGKVHTRNKGGLLRSDVRLYVGSRDCTKLVRGMGKQVLAVDDAVRDLTRTTPVTPVLCFVEADWPTFGSKTTLDGVHILWPRALLRLVRRPGPLTEDEIVEVAERLLERLPQA